MNFGKGKAIRDFPTEKNILERVSEKEIFEMYLGSFHFDLIKSPLRDDKNPSFSLFFSKKYNRVFFKDFATNEIGDCFVFVMRKFNMSRKIDVYNKIARDFSLNDLETGDDMPLITNIRSNKTKENHELHSSRRSDIKVKTREWNKDDYAYWKGKYGLFPNQLEYCGVYPISHFFVNGLCSKADKLSYAFLEEKDGMQTFKIYQPLTTSSKKWMNNNDHSTWELWTQLPKQGNVLIVTSSRKDAIVIKSLFPSKGITSCSLQSEGVNPKESVVNELKSRFKKVFVLYDNDFNSSVNRGRLAGKRIEDSTGFTQIEIPSSLKSKDPSDCVEKHGRELLRKLILSLVGKTKK
jgi:hypothetical protein